MAPNITMYSRRRCGLCDKARTAIQESRHHGVEFEFDERFIDGDADLERRFGLRVPVVLVDGREEFEFEVDPQRLRRVLASL
jgi:glutaredoxin